MSIKGIPLDQGVEQDANTRTSTDSMYSVSFQDEAITEALNVSEGYTWYTDRVE
jgi:hypothetical protein